MIKTSNLTKYINLLGILSLITLSFSTALIQTFAKDRYDNALDGKYSTSLQEVLILQHKSSPLIQEVASEFYTNSLSEKSTDIEVGLEKSKFGKIYEFDSNQVIALKDSVLNHTQLTPEQVKANYQIHRYLELKIDDLFGIKFTSFNLNSDHSAELEAYMYKDETYLSLSSIASKTVVRNNNGIFGIVDAQAWSWENCELETGFNNTTIHENKSYWGAQSNWTGRSGNSWNEINYQPCDYVFYMNNYAMNKIDGWSYHAWCIVQKRGGNWSRKTYGSNSNNKVIMGYFTMLQCGPVVSTSYYNYWIRFYTN